MKINIILILAVILSSLNLNGQTRNIYGKVISEHLEPLPGVHITSSDNIPLGMTDMNGLFKISIPKETNSLSFLFLGMASTDIKLKKDCDTIEIIMLYRDTYNYRSHKKIDKFRKKLFDEVPKIYSNALKEGLFSATMCYEREFKHIKPELDAIRKELKDLSKASNLDFKNLNIGDIVKIPFGVDSLNNSIRTLYAPCRNCTNADYDYFIEGQIINKRRRKLTLEIQVTKMPKYEYLNFDGIVLKINKCFKYRMKYFEVIIDQ